MKLPFKKAPDSFEQALESIEGFERFRDALRKSQQNIQNNPAIHQVAKPIDYIPYETVQESAAIKAVGEAALSASHSDANYSAQIIPFRPKR